MTPSRLRATTVLERIAWINQMLAGIRALPMDDFGVFQADPRNIASAESYLRRGLEALFDLGRHLLAKGFGIAVTEYKEIAPPRSRSVSWIKILGACCAIWRATAIDWFTSTTQFPIASCMTSAPSSQVTSKSS